MRAISYVEGPQDKRLLSMIRIKIRYIRSCTWAFHHRVYTESKKNKIENNKNNVNKHIGNHSDNKKKILFSQPLTEDH